MVEGARGGLVEKKRKKGAMGEEDVETDDVCCGGVSDLSGRKFVFCWCSVLRKLKGSVPPSCWIWKGSAWFSGVLKDGCGVDTVTKGPGVGVVGWWKTNADGKEVKPSLEGVGVGEKLGEVGETRWGENSV